MENIPLVSVVIPNYNYARYLEQRIESVLNQTFTDFEIILLDDASTDESVQVMERYRVNEHVTRIVVNGQNTGSPFKQWMKGIQLARGKYIWIAEADDCAEPDFLETCVMCAEREENVSVCYAGSLLFDAEGNIERRDVNHWRGREKRKSACFDGELYAERNLYWKNYIINASGVLFNRENALRLSDSDFVDMRFCGDWMFWFEMALQGKVIEIYRNLNYFRQHTAKATTASRRFGDGIMEDIRIVQHMESRLSGLSRYRKRLRRGLLYRKINRQSLDKDNRQRLFEAMAGLLQSNISDFRLERMNQLLRCILPGLPTVKRDRL